VRVLLSESRESTARSYINEASIFYNNRTMINNHDWCCGRESVTRFVLAKHKNSEKGMRPWEPTEWEYGFEYEWISDYQVNYQECWCLQYSMKAYYESIKIKNDYTEIY